MDWPIAPLRGAWRRTATIVPRSAPAGDLPVSSGFAIKNMNFNYLVRNLNGQNQDPDRFRRLLRPTPEADEASSSAISFVGPWVGTWWTALSRMLRSVCWPNLQAHKLSRLGWMLRDATVRRFGTFRWRYHHRKSLQNRWREKASETVGNFFLLFFTKNLTRVQSQVFKV